MSRDAKKSAYHFGRSAETLCCWRLRLAGYRILERSYRQSTGEVDIIARRGNVLAFIEVKARASFSSATQALGSRQRRRLERTAEIFLGHYPGATACETRFDLMVVSPWRWPGHIKGAWLSGE